MGRDCRLHVVAVICGSSKLALPYPISEETQNEDGGSLLRKEINFVIRVEGVTLGKCMFVWQLGVYNFPLRGYQAELLSRINEHASIKPLKAHKFASPNLNK